MLKFKFNLNFVVLGVGGNQLSCELCGCVGVNVIHSSLSFLSCLVFLYYYYYYYYYNKKEQ